MMQNAFGNECMNKTRIKEWYNRFKRGRTSVDSDSRSGRPSTTKTLDNIERVRHSIALLRQPPYSPDIAPCDFWLFPKLKKPLKGQ